MPFVTTNDGVKLYYEDTGTGIPIVFIHELAGDVQAYEPQVRYFSRRYRCITYNARGYPPSDVPEDTRYSQERARDDVLAVLDALMLENAHLVGLSMGGFATLHFGFTYPQRARSLIIGGCGYGAEPDKREQFAREAEASAASFEALGMAEGAERYAQGPTRVQHQNKDPRGWRELVAQFSAHSVKGVVATLRGVQKCRPSLYDLVDKMKTITAPTLIIAGDEDWPCLGPGIMMKRTIPTAGLVVMPNTGHAVNLEEPAAFNQHLMDFFHAVDLNKWPRRDSRAMGDSILGSGEKR